jgi:ABC-2 type transport system ATP-binding protein
LFLTTQYLDEADQLADNIVVVDHGRIIAQGTPLELKDQSGAASLVITVSRPGEVDRAAELVRSEVGELHVDHDARRITAPAEGVGALTRIAARLDEAGIDLDDIGLQRPSLDDVFLNLTGHKAEVEVEPESSHDEQKTEAVR